MAISTGMEAAVVMRPDIIEEQKCRKILSAKYPENKKIRIMNIEFPINIFDLYK